MSNQKRVLVEVAVVVLLVVACFSVWSLSQRRSDRMAVEQRDESQKAIHQLRQECDARAAQLAEDQAKAVFRAFAAGIQGSAIAQQKGVLDMAKGGLLQMPRIAFVHVLTADGRVLMSSDEKYEVSGRADGRAAWALQAADLTTRAGDLPGTTELAAPFKGGTDGSAVLWMGYKTEELQAAASM